MLLAGCADTGLNPCNVVGSSCQVGQFQLYTQRNTVWNRGRGGLSSDLSGLLGPVLVTYFLSGT